MSKITIGLRITILVLFILYVILAIKFYNGYIPNIQAYSNLHFIPIMFWSFIILVCYTFMMADSGFLKIGFLLGIVTGVLMLTFQFVNNTSSFDSLNSDKYQLIIEIKEMPSESILLIYTRDSLFFSEYIDSESVENVFDFTYEIVGDSLVITKCSVNGCVTSNIDLE